MAIIKSDSYGHLLNNVVQDIDDIVDGYGVVRLDEALSIRKISSKKILLMQGVYTDKDLKEAQQHSLDLVIHNKHQFNLIKSNKYYKNLWFKINTGMNRLGFEVDEFLDIYNTSLAGTWGFVPLSKGEVNHMAKHLKHLIVPELSLVAEVDGKPIGTVFCLLDYNSRIKAMNGRLFPFGFLKLLWNKSAIKRMRAISTNVVPEYQAWGVGLVLHAALVPRLYKWGMKEVEFSWVLESNHLSKRTLERGGALVTKKYRIYQDDPLNDEDSVESA